MKKADFEFDANEQMEPAFYLKNIYTSEEIDYKQNDMLERFKGSCKYHQY